MSVESDVIEIKKRLKEIKDFCVLIDNKYKPDDDLFIPKSLMKEYHKSGNAVDRLIILKIMLESDYLVERKTV